MDRGEIATYAASSALGDLIRDLRERGLLEGEIRDSVLASLDEFIARRTGEPMETWHVDLVDLYEDLSGRSPEHREP